MDVRKARICQPRKDNVQLDMVLAELQRQLHQCSDEMRVIEEFTCRVSRENSELLAKISHEIASPLSGVIRLARLMQNSELGFSQKKCIATIIQSCQLLEQSLCDAANLSGTDGVPALEIAEQKSNGIDDPLFMIDVGYVNKMRSDFSGGVFASLVQQYCSDTERTLRDLEHAEKIGDFSTVKNLLHLLKGCSANFGAAAIVELCSDYTERLNRVKSMTKNELAHLKQIYEDTKKQLLQVVGPVS